MVLTALLGLALWQKARDHLPYLLDPSASPPPRVSLSDGLVAAMLFFVRAGAGGHDLRAERPEEPTGQRGADRLLHRGRRHLPADAVRLLAAEIRGGAAHLRRRHGRALAWGAGGGALAALAAFAYLRAGPAHLAVSRGARESVLVGVQDELWIAVLAVVAAPIFEEFIFRGLIFGGLRRTLGLTVSVLASAAIFALVHPPFSVIPVFGLGIATALVYERTRLLIGPIAVHAVYNAAVVGLQFLPGW